MVAEAFKPHVSSWEQFIGTKRGWCRDVTVEIAPDRSVVVKQYTRGIDSSSLEWPEVDAEKVARDTLALEDTFRKLVRADRGKRPRIHVK